MFGVKYFYIFKRKVIFLGIFELVSAVALSMDAFAVAMCKGLATERVKPKHMLTVGLWFGGFQALMPSLGYILGVSAQKIIQPIDHIIAFLLLGAIGANMIKESFSKEENEADSCFGCKTMLIMAIATSIDAFAAGIAFTAEKNLNIYIAVLFIGIITFTLSAIGVKLGNIFGAKYKSKAELAGGVILMGLGLKILIEHLINKI